MLKKNVGMIDRAVRVIAALVIFGLYFTGSIGGTLGAILLVFAVIFILTSLLSSCPLYTLVGLSTKKE